MVLMTQSITEATNDLPISNKRSEIITAVDNYQVTIITAETGAGKSTQVPQYLAAHGYSKIIVTQPRILAARNLCARVREEMAARSNADSTGLVGYRTAHERDDDPENVILYCTDGLQLVRELTGNGSGKKQILVLDEIHEWNENMEVLIAWAKRRCLDDPDFKVVLMSATIEAGRLAEYFGSAAVVSVAGRSFPVEKRHGVDVVAEIFSLLDSHTSNILVFLPGKAEIEDVAAAIQKKATAHHVPVLPLHSQLEPAVQQRVFENYESGKIILSTNIAQTSVTIDDIDTVIDSGLERRSEVRSGVEGLFIAEASQADCMQRAGRAGRTKEGLYVLAQLNDLPCMPLEKRPEYGVPEILRKHIDRLVLRLANIGLDIEELDFYHQPKPGAIKQAKGKLVTLGALTGKGTVTEIGHKMEKFPVESAYARMLVEAETYSQESKAKLAAIIAIQEVGGIVKNSARYSGWRRLTHQSRSDLLAQYDVYLALPGIIQEEYEDMGIIAKNVSKAEEINERLIHDLHLGNLALSPVGDEELTPLLRAITAGQLDQLWTVEPNGEVVHIGNGNRRELSSGTTVKNAQLVAATPFDLQVPTPTGLRTLQLVTDVTAVEPTWLETLAPHIFQVKPGKVYFDPMLGTLAVRTHLAFHGGALEAGGQPVLEHTQQNRRLFVKLFAAWAHSQIEKERMDLQSVNSRKVPAVPLLHIEQRVMALSDNAISLDELDKKRRAALMKLIHLESYIGESFMGRLNQPNHGERHRKQRYTPSLRYRKPKYNRRHGR